MIMPAIDKMSSEARTKECPIQRSIGVISWYFSYEHTAGFEWNEIKYSLQNSQ